MEVGFDVAGQYEQISETNRNKSFVWISIYWDFSSLYLTNLFSEVDKLIRVIRYDALFAILFVFFPMALLAFSTTILDLK